MKKLFIALMLIVFATSANAWTLVWDDVTGEDGYILSYKPYPDEYSFPGNQAPDAAIKDMAGVTRVNLPADTKQWAIPQLTPGNDMSFLFRPQRTVR